MSGDERLIATSSQTVGPFFHFALTSEPNGRLADRMPGAGERVTLAVRVSDGGGVPVADAMIEVLQAGVFGRMPTGEDGACEFHIVRPDGLADGRPAGHAGHVHVCIFARGLLRQLHTRIYFAGDPALDADPVLALLPEARRVTLLATPDATDGSRWIFDLRLQGGRETVFFDG